MALILLTNYKKIMNSKLTKTVIFFLLLSVSLSINAQKGGDSDYKNGIGLRLGGGYYDIASASFKTFVTPKGAIELNLGIRPYNYTYASTKWVNVSFSASYQHHFPIGKVEGLKWFIGGGATVYNTFSNNKNYSGIGLGVFPTGGVDYKFKNIPLNVSADLRPTISLVEPYSYYSSFYLGNGGISARYTF